MYIETCLMWSPMGPHVQWNLSNVVTYGTSCTVGPLIHDSKVKFHPTMSHAVFLTTNRLIAYPGIHYPYNLKQLKYVPQHIFALFIFHQMERSGGGISLIPCTGNSHYSATSFFKVRARFASKAPSYQCPL